MSGTNCNQIVQNKQIVVQNKYWQHTHTHIRPNGIRLIPEGGDNENGNKLLDTRRW